MSTTFDFQQSPSCCQGSWADDKCTHDVIRERPVLLVSRTKTADQQPSTMTSKSSASRATSTPKSTSWAYYRSELGADSSDLEMDGPQSAIHNCPSKPSVSCGHACGPSAAEP